MIPELNQPNRTVQAKLILPWHETNRILIGTASPCHVRLEDRGIADRHVEIWREPEVKYFCRSLATSENGQPVKKNCQSIREDRIVPGDLLQIGHAAFIFRGDHLERYSMGTGIGVRNLRVKRGTKEKEELVLNDLSLSVAPGQFVGLFGPSGCGKTTLVDCILGRRKSEGTVELDGTEPVGYVAQHDLLYPYLTVRENLDFSLRISSPRLIADERDGRIADVLDLLGLTDITDQRVGPREHSRISGGQRKRVNVAIELIRQPKTLILDEPTSGLDPHTQKELTENLRELAGRRGVGIIVVSHALETLPYYDKVVVLRTLTPLHENSLLYVGDADRDRILKKLGIKDLSEMFEPCTPKLPNEYNSPASNFDDREKPASAEAGKRKWKERKKDSLVRIQTVATRCFRHLCRDRWRLTVTIFLPVLLGLLIAAALWVYRADNPVSGGYFASWIWILPSVMFALAALWVGMSLTVREVVEERAFFARDVRAGLGWCDYLLGKILFAMVIACGQALVLTLCLAIPLGLSPLWVLVPIAVLVAFGGAIMGLSISAIAPSPATAILLMPLLLIPHILFNGSIVDGGRNLNDRNSAEELVTRYVPIAYLPEPRKANEGAWLSDRLHAYGSMILISRPAVAASVMAQSRKAFRRVPDDEQPRFTAAALRAEFSYLLVLLLIHLLILMALFRLCKQRLLNHSN